MMSSTSVPLSDKQKGTMPETAEGASALAEHHQRNFTVSQVPAPPYMKLANPGPLGLLGFAVTTFALGLYECGAG